MKFNKAHGFFIVLIIASGFAATFIDALLGFEHSGGFFAFAMHDLFQKFVGATMILLLLYANRLEAAAKAKKAAKEFTEGQQTNPQ